MVPPSLPDDVAKAKLINYFQTLDEPLIAYQGFSHYSWTLITRELLGRLYGDVSLVALPEPSPEEHFPAPLPRVWARREATGQVIRRPERLTLYGAYQQTVAALVRAERQRQDPPYWPLVANHPHLLDLYCLLTEHAELLRGNAANQLARARFKSYANNFYGQAQHRQGTYRIQGLKQVPGVLGQYWDEFQERFFPYLVQVDTDSAWLVNLTDEQRQLMRAFWERRGYSRLDFESRAGLILFGGKRYHAWQGKLSDHEFNHLTFFTPDDSPPRQPA